MLKQVERSEEGSPGGAERLGISPRTGAVVEANDRTELVGQQAFAAVERAAAQIGDRSSVTLDSGAQLAIAGCQFGSAGLERSAPFEKAKRGAGGRVVGDPGFAVGDGCGEHRRGSGLCPS